MKWIAVLAVLAVVLVEGWCRAAEVGKPIDGGAFVEEFIQGSMRLRADPGMSADQKTQTLRHFLDERYDMPDAMNFILGHYWADAPPQQRRRYLVVFEDYMLARYGAQFDVVAGRLAVVGVTIGADGRSIVRTAVSLDGNGAIAVDWILVRRDGPGWLISDVSIGGVSLTELMRQDFSAVLRANQGNVEALLAAIRHRTEALAKAG